MHIPAPVTLVTGSSRGLGFEIAQEFQARGDKVHVVWRTEGERIAPLQEQFRGRTHRCDLTSEEASAGLVERILEIDGKIDHVVHCVGDYFSSSLEDTEPGVWRGLLESNLMTAVNLAQALREPLRAGGAGTLVFFLCAGITAQKARRSCAAYAAAKSALHSFARSLALEEAPHGVRVNTISPGLVPHAHAHPSTCDPELHASIPLGRPGSAQDVARSALWLSSSDSSYAVGIDLCVSGGWLL